MPSLPDALQTLVEMGRDVLPIVAVLAVFQLFVLRRKLPNPMRLLQGLIFVMAGLVLFLMGLEQAVFPIGKTMAAQLTALAFAIGFSTTIAEPALIAVALKAEELSGGAINAWGLRIAVAIGVAIGISLGALRIVLGTPLHYFIGAGYVVVVVQTLFAPRAIVPLAYGRSPLIDGFGLIAFASLFPMLTVMTYAQASKWWTARGNAREVHATDPLGSTEDRP
jgi:hypothetical protein